MMDFIKQFQKLYNDLAGKVETTWIFGLYENAVVAYPEFDTQPKEFRPLFKLTKLDINKGLESQKWDRCFGILRIAYEKHKKSCVL